MCQVDRLLDAGGMPGAFDFSSFRTLFASTSVAKKVVARLEEKERQNVVALLHGGMIGERAGLLFEQYAHSVLRKGGKFRLHCLGGPCPPPSEGCGFSLAGAGSDLLLTLEGTSDTQFGVPSRLPDFSRLSIGVYWLPSIPNFAMADSVLLLNTATFLFQCTVSDSHDVNQAGLLNILVALPASASHNVILTFVLRDVAGDAAVLQSYKFDTRHANAVNKAVERANRKLPSSSQPFSVSVVTICMSVNQMIALVGGVVPPG